MLLLALGVWYAKGYFEWEATMAPYVENARSAQEYWKVMQKQSADLEEKYKNDTYGGNTPEETLALYIEALEKGDLKLASMYYIPEEQDAHERTLNRSRENGNVKGYIDILSLKKVVGVSEENHKADIEFFEKEKQVHVLFLTQNPFTNKWKLFSNK